MILAALSYLVIFYSMSGVYGSADLVDLSYPYNNVTVSPPSDDMWRYELLSVHKGPWEGHGNVWFEMNNFRMNEHAGTHVDAPTHFNKNGWDPAEIPVDRLYRLPAVVVDISSRAELDPHAQLLSEDLEKWEKTNGIIPSLAAILVNSNWGVKWGTPAYTNIVRDAQGNITDMRFPSISPEAAQWLVDNRPYISCVGIDTTSIEYEPGYNYTTHRILLGKNIYAIENAANLHKLPSKGAFVSVMPIRLSYGSGAAARIIAELPGYRPMINVATITESCTGFIILLSCFVLIVHSN